MEIMDTVDKEIKVGDVCWFIKHSVYGNPNAPLNEPKVYEVIISKHENGLYNGNWTKGPGCFLDVPEKLVHKTEVDARNYIKEHRNEIIKESFENHKRQFEEQLKRARKPLF